MIYFEVTDDDMVGDRIASGDIIVVKLQDETTPFDISCIIHRSKRILRKIERREHGYLLTSSFDEIECDDDDVIVLGKVTMNLYRY